MKGALLSVGLFAAGVLAGAAGLPAAGADATAAVLLCVLMFLVGVSVGRSPALAQVACALRSPHMLLLPLATLAGTLLFSAVAGWLLTRWGVPDCLAVGSGMGYYSLSSVLITQLRTPALGTGLAAQLGAVALLANVFRELLALTGAKLFRRRFGRWAPIAVGGATTADVTLPVILRVSGVGVAAPAVCHGLLLDLSVPLLVTAFCS